MKILHINCNYVYTALHQIMIEKLDELNIDNTVFVPVYDKNKGTIKVNQNVKVVECFNKWDRLLFDYKSKKIRNALKKCINVSSYDLIHAYTLFTDGNVAYRLYQEYNIPYVVAVRNTDVNDFLKHMIHLRSCGIEIMEHAAAVFFLSESYKIEVFNKYIPEEKKDAIKGKTYVIPNGIDDFWFKNLFIDRQTYNNKTLRIIYAGSIDSNKNIETTQKALDILKNRGMDVHFTIVGKVVEPDVFERVKKDAHSTYVKAQPKESLINYYRKADIFVMPSHKETFGLVYAEAMSQGLPIIYTKGQGFDGQFKEGIVGFHVDDNKPEEIADAIEKICHNYEKMVRSSLEMVEKFKWHSICKKYKSIYDIIIK